MALQQWDYRTVNGSKKISADIDNMFEKIVYVICE